MTRMDGFKIATALGSLFLWAAVAAPAACQLASRQPDDLNTSQQLHVIRALESVFPESMGFRVNAPMEPAGGTREDFARLVRAFRVIVPEEVTVTQAASRLTSRGSPFIRYSEIERQAEFHPVLPLGYAGVPVTAVLDNRIFDVQFLTVNMDRWLIWARTCYFPVWKGDRDTPMQEYAASVSQYLRRTDFGEDKPPELDPSAVGAPRKSDLFGGIEPRRQGAAEYQTLASSNMEIDIARVSGVTGFSAGRGAIDWLIDHRRRAPFTDMNQGDLQRVFYDFTADGRDFQELRELTPDVLAELEPGFYFYAVDTYGRVRFGPMRIDPSKGPEGLWEERIKSYECLLFPGQPVVAAGEFQIVGEESPLEASLQGAAAPSHRIAAVDAFSAYYFYHPGDKNLERQMKGRSDDYLKTVGHFFKALEDMGVDPIGVHVSKF